MTLVFYIHQGSSKETVSKASQFFPRFFIPVSSTYDDLCSVLNKMISQTK